MSEPHLAPAPVGYSKPAMTRLAVDDGVQPGGLPASPATLSAMDLLRVVQSALDELGLPMDGHVAELKRSVLEEVSAGRLANAMKLAIVHSAAATADARSRS